MPLDLFQARQLFEQQRWHDLLAMLADSPAAQWQENPEFLFLHSRANSGLGQPELGVFSLQRACQLDPESLPLRWEMVEALLAAEEWSWAYRVLTDSSDTRLLQTPLGQWGLARVQVRLGHRQEAEAIYVALQQEGEIDLLRLGIGLTDWHIFDGDFKRARFCLDRLAALDGAAEEAALLELELLEHDVSIPQRRVAAEAVRSTCPNSRRVLLKLACLYERALLIDEAEDTFRCAIDRHGLDGRLRIAFQDFLVAQARVDDLRWTFSQPTSGYWDTPEPLMLAQCLYNAGNYDEALAILETQDHSEYRSGLLAMVYSALGRFEDSLQLRRELHQASPNNFDLQSALARELLALAHWQEAWPHYAARLKGSNRFRCLPPGMEEVRSDQPPDQANVVVFGEQGIGDTIMMASMLPELQQHAASVKLLLTPRLLPLFEATFPDIPCSSEMNFAQFKAMERCYALGSLGRFFRPSPESCSGQPYLQVPPELLMHWKQTLQSLGSGLKIGVAWRGGGTLENKKQRSMTLPLLLPLLQTPGIQWVNLQYGNVADELEELRNNHQIKIHHFEGITQDLLQTTALTQALDLVITVQQTALHIAGAVGTSAWVLLPQDAEWRYGRSKSTMPWYASVELFRQQLPGVWDHPLELVKERLVCWLAEAGGQNEQQLPS
ncbi:tetratricopeptide repeat family protein [Synechococcus sp. Minos11]|nr:tetratricopeptide repeat family protein [Synechococcus sp. Minos11]